MRIGIHQPNFCPHFGFFYKMSQCDKFIILTQCQFEKNGYQNRYFLQGKQRYVTMPVQSGLTSIHEKKYANGLALDQLNMNFILWARDVLDIKVDCLTDVVTNNRGTQRLIDNLNYYGATVYVTNPHAKDKYLDEKLIKDVGIDIEYSDHPLAKYNILEMFETHGIEGTRKLLWKSKALKQEAS